MMEVAFASGEGCGLLVLCARLSLGEACRGNVGGDGSNNVKKMEADTGWCVVK